MTTATIDDDNTNNIIDIFGYNNQRVIKKLKSQPMISRGVVEEQN
jgi:hypothetical protein